MLLPPFRSCSRVWSQPTDRLSKCALVTQWGGFTAALVPLLNSRNVNLRATAFRALGRFGDAAKPASSALNECLYDPEEWVRREATNLLRQIEAAAAAKAGVK